MFELSYVGVVIQLIGQLQSVHINPLKIRIK